MSMDRFGDYLLERMYPGEPAPMPTGQQQGDVLMAEVGSRGLPERAYTGVNPDKIEEVDPTTRQKLADFLQAGFEGTGMERSQARKTANQITGGPSSTLIFNSGLLDYLPYIGTALQTEEAVIGGKAAVESASRGQYGNAAIEGGAAAIGMIPGASSTVKATKSAAKKIKAVTGPKE